MTAVRLQTFSSPWPDPDRPPAPTAGPVLTRIRLAALRCRSARHADLFEACAVLSTDCETARTAHVEVLTRCLRQALDRAPVFHRPGTSQISFDEAWLLRLISASKAGDHDSFSFLIRARVRRPAQRSLAFLVHQIAAHFG